MSRINTYHRIKAIAGAMAILTCTILTTAPIQAQSYPAQASLNILPPYSPYLSDYLQPGQERINLTVNFFDLAEPSWDAKIRLRIEGNGIRLQTSNPFLQPITLTPGPNIIGPEVIQPLIDFTKMDVTGTSKTDLVNAGRLPEGSYEFCFDILDAGREVALALPACRTALLIQNNPPQLVAPECGATITAAGGQNIQFNWIPMHDPSIQTRYEIKIVQVPTGMNVNDAINATSTPILDWYPVQTPSFLYGPEQLPLEVGQLYAFQVRVVDIQGLTTFENDGKGPVCWFTYGFSTGGEIPLTAPAQDARVDDPERVDFAWQGPSNAVTGQQIKYHLKVVKLNQGETLGNPANAQAIIDRTQGVWYQDSTDIMPNIFGGALTVEQPLEPGATYAWQVQASTEGIKVAKSEVWAFKAPPVIFSFWCADGAYNVIVTEVLQHTRVSPTKFTGLQGTGTVILVENEQPTDVQFSNLTVEMVANKWILKQGEVVIEKTESKELDFQDYGAGDFAINAWVLTPLQFLAQGKLTWRFPLSVNTPGNAVVVSDDNVRLNYLNKILSGSVPLAPNQGYNLLVPMGFSINYRTPSSFIVKPDATVLLKLFGNVGFPQALKTADEEPFTIAFENQENPWYMEVPRIEGGTMLKLFGQTKMSLQPKSFTIDFSPNKSPAGIFASNNEWVGVYLTEYNIFLPNDLDDNARLALTQPQVVTFKATDPTYQPAWISSGGLNLDVNTQFDAADTPPYTATNHTFKGKIATLRLKIEDNSLSDSRITGFIKVPFLDPNRKIDWIAPIAANGIQTGYFQEDSIRAFSREYSKDDPVANVNLQINQATFSGEDHIDLNVNLDWPYVKVKLDNTAGLKIWGNGDIGFGEPSGKKDLPTQVPVQMGSMAGIADGVGAFYENTVYGFMLFTQVKLPGGITSPGLPIKVGVASTGGAPAPPIVYTRVDGKVKEGKFRIGPAKVSMDNSLIYAELFADFVDDDKHFGTRFEAKGNVMVKQPEKIVANARLVIGEKDNVGFWYARLAAQGLNKVLEPYPAFHLNGFDFKIYHHLAKPEGSAFTKPDQFNDFWNLDNAKDSSDAIDGHTIDGNVALGMYGKIGLHDAASGRKQESKPINITETIPQIGDILPEIPGICDLTYNGKSICKYVKWPWEGLSLCDLEVPTIENGTPKFKSICQVQFLTIDWPTLQFCDLALKNGKKLGDYTLADLGFSNIDICDLKLPNGFGLCEYFDIKGKFCDIREGSGSICQRKLCDVIPQIPPVCTWKIPGIKPICNFNIGDIIPDINACAVIEKAGGQSIFCNWSWPDILPDLPNPCDLKLPNGDKLCNLSIDWCDIIVPTIRNQQPALVPLCQVKWFEIDWPSVNPCDWKVGGTPICSLSVQFCDLKHPLTGKKACDLIPDLCELREPITGKRICDIPLWDIDWPNFNFCDLKWPGTDRKVCDLSLNYCDLKNPITGQRPWICDLTLPDLIPDMPNFCDVEFTIEGRKYEMCSWGLDFDLPSICDLKLVNDLELCKIKLPDFDIPEVSIPEVPGIPGLPKNMYQTLIMGGLRVEVQNSGAIRQVAVDGSMWFFTDRFDPNSSYLARGFGGIEFWPSQNKIQVHAEAEAGSVKTDLGTIKPICGGGTLDAMFTPDDWYINVGSPQTPWDIELGCSEALSCGGYILANPKGILAHGEIDESAETEYSIDIGPADLGVYAEGHMSQSLEIGVAFDNPAIFGALEFNVGGSAGVTVDPDIGSEYDVEFASVEVGGDVNFKLGSSICLAGTLYGEVTVLGVGVDIKLGLEVRDGSVDFPSDPDPCY